MSESIAYIAGIITGVVGCIFLVLLEKKAQENGSSLLQMSTDHFDPKTWGLPEQGLIIEPKTDGEIRASEVIEENDSNGEPTKIEDIL